LHLYIFPSPNIYIYLVAPMRNLLLSEVGTLSVIKLR
jgi:hypothetical protein